MKNIFTQLKKNALVFSISLFFYFLFLFYTLTGNRIFNNDATGRINPGQTYTHGSINHYYHK